MDFNPSPCPGTAAGPGPFRRELGSIDTWASVLKQIAAATAADTAADTRDYREDETRTALIDDLLRDAGWTLDGPDDREYPVDGLPIIPGKNATGTGRVDYVLWGEDRLPLGIVEAKRTLKDPAVGAPQAKLYADALEKRYGQRRRWASTSTPTSAAPCW